MDIAKVAEGLGIDLPSIAKALNVSPDASIEDLTAAVEALAMNMKGIAGLANPTPPAATADAAAAQPEEAKQLSAFRAQVLHETEETSDLLALSRLTEWKAAVIKLEKDQAKVKSDRATMEMAERKTLAARLVKLGKETPHTSGLAYPGGLAKHLVDMPIADLRSRVASFEKGAKANAGDAPATPPTGQQGAFEVEGESVELTPAQLKLCAKKKIDPAKFAATKAALNARTIRGGTPSGDAR